MWGMRDISLCQGRSESLPMEQKVVDQNDQIQEIDLGVCIRPDVL